MRTILCCTLAALLVSAGVLHADDKKADPIDAKKLIGKWEVKEQEGGRLVIEFTKDGKTTVTITNDQGKETRREGTYKVEGDKVLMTAKDGDMERTKTLVVSKLTETEMIATDDKGR